MVFLRQFIEHLVPFISEAALNDFSSIVSLAKYKKGHIIANQGQVPTKFYLLKSGLMRTYVIDKKGKEHIRTIFIPVSTSGALSSLIQGTSSSSIYDCLTDCEILEGNFSVFLKLTEKHHDLSLFYNRILEKIFIGVESRIYDLSVLNATERYLKLKKEIPNIEGLIPLYHIASYLNITPVQLSRIRKEIYSK